jgi:hypothetical protein
MNPVELTCRLELLGTKRKGKEDFRVRKIAINALIGVVLDDLELRKLGLEFLGEPLGRNPEVKPMMRQNKQLHAIGCKLSFA